MRNTLFALVLCALVFAVATVSRTSTDSNSIDLLHESGIQILQDNESWLRDADMSRRSSNISICAFNIQVFGVTKMSKPEVRDAIVKILRQFSVVFIQEIRDATQTAFQRLMELINEDTSIKYDYYLSEPLGRSFSKEQYAYIYRVDQIEVVKAIQFPDPSDWFERAPYGIILQPIDHPSSQFTIMGCHISPGTAPEEIDHLYDVYVDWKKEGLIQKERIMFMGDFNAGCGYVPKYKWPTIRLRTDPKFDWLIGDDTPTTVKGKGCPYDRIIVGQGLVSWIPKPDKQVGVFNYTEIYHYSYDLSTAISDHYPVFSNIFLRDM